MRFERRYALVMWILGLLLAAVPAAAQNVSVTSADPNVGEQESVGLQVRVKGRGFNQGARAEFLLEDNSTGGITVLSTQLVSSSELVATINIDTNAATTFFDIRVTNTNGRTGRGSDLFQVVEKGAKGGNCEPAGVPAGFVELAALNTGAIAMRNMAIDMKVAPVTVNGTNVLMAAVSSGSHVEVYFLGATGTNGITVDTVNPHRTLVLSTTTRLVQSVAVGDVNQDGTPDVVAADYTVAALFLGQRTAEGHVTFAAPIYLAAAGEPAVNVGRALAIGNLDPGVAGDEIVVTQTGQKGGKTGTFLPVAHIYSFDNALGVVTRLRSIRPSVSPSLTYDEGFGYSIAIADVYGSGDLDLIGASRKKGQVWIFPGPSLDLDDNNGNGYQPLALANLPTFQVGAGNVDGTAGAEILATTAWGSFASYGDVIRGLAADTGYRFDPEQGGLAKGWSTKGVVVGDFNGDLLPDLAVGAPNAEPSSACTNMGAAYVFLGQQNGGWRRLRLNPSSYNGTFNAYGWSMAFGTVDGLRLLLVGEQGADVNGVDNAGQVYVYRVDTP